MKRILIILCLCATLLCGCGSGEEATSAPSASAQKAVTEASEQAADVSELAQTPIVQDALPTIVDKTQYYAVTQEEPEGFSMATQGSAVEQGIAFLGYWYQEERTDTVVQVYTSTGLQQGQTLELEEQNYAEAFFATEDAIIWVEVQNTEDGETATHQDLLHIGQTEADISAALESHNAVQGLYADSDSIWVVADTGVLLTNRQGETVQWCPSEVLLTGIIRTGTGDPLILSETSDGLAFYAMEEQQLVLICQTGSAFCDMRVVSGLNTAYDCLLMDNQSLYGWDVGSDHMDCLIDFLDAGLNPNYISTCAAAGDDIYIGTTWTSGVSGDRIFFLTPAQPPSEQITLTIGGISTPTALASAISDFNMAHPEYEVVFTDYEELYGDNAEQELRKALLAGEGPDILCLNGLNRETYTQSGFLADLYTLMDADGGADAFLSGPLSVLESADGSLYALPQSVSLCTVAGLKSVVGDRTSWSLDEFYSVSAEHSATAVFYSQTPAALLSELVFQCMSQFVDYADGTAYFDSDAFVQLLEFCQAQPDNATFVNTEETACLLDGEILLSPLLLSSFEMYENLYTDLNGDMALVGYPGANGAALYLNNPMAITAQSTNQSIAWTFLQEFLSTERYRNRGGWPLLQTEYDACVQEALDSGIASTTIDAVTQLLQTADHVAAYDETIAELVSEEASDYFSGRQTAAETAAFVQQRVQIYLDEQG